MVLCSLLQLKKNNNNNKKKKNKGPEIFNQSLMVLKYGFILLEILLLQNFKEPFWKAGQQKLLHSNIIISVSMDSYTAFLALVNA